jgi:hypothetical protein
MKKVITIIMVLVFGFFCGGLWERAQWEALPPPEVPLPSIVEIQRKVGAKPDGILGKETQKKWDDAYNNQSAEIWFVESEIE